MKTITWINAAAFVATLAVSTAAAWIPLLGRRTSERRETPSADAVAKELRDHSGVAVPPAEYRRIVSASTTADALLLDLCEPDRIVAFTGHSEQDTVDAYRFAGKAVIDLRNVEAVLALRPDLVFVNAIGDPHRIARLRDAGLVVYDLGEMRGMATLIRNAEEIASIIGRPERGRELAQKLRDRMNGIAADVPRDRRRRAMYVSYYGGRIFGGATGTSFHDILVAAGLVDAASGLRDWPQYTAEQVLALAPDVLVTNAGMEQALCGHAGLAALEACRDAGGVVEVNEDLLGDPGPRMLDAAQAVRDIVYGPPRGASPE